MTKFNNLIIGSKQFDLTSPVVMGVLNVTPDSFSDGGLYFSHEAAVEHAAQMISEGADIIDIGGESTRPGSEPVSLDEELRRVIPLIEIVRKMDDTSISIDTQKAAVAKRAIEAGANMVNDVSAGRADPDMLRMAAKAKVPICLMHMKGTPKTMQIDPSYDDVMASIEEFFLERIGAAEKAGIEPHNIIIDPGIGFGKTPEDNLTIILNINRLARFNKPIILGASRKSFIGKLLGLDVDKRLEATLASIAKAYENGVRMFRVHDVAPTRRFLSMLELFR